MSALWLVPNCSLFDYISFGMLCTVLGLNSLTIHLFIPEGVSLNFVFGVVLPEMFLEIAHVNCLRFNIKSKVAEQ